MSVSPDGKSSQRQDLTSEVPLEFGVRAFIFISFTIFAENSFSYSSLILHKVSSCLKCLKRDLLSRMC